MIQDLKIVSVDRNNVNISAIIGDNNFVVRAAYKYEPLWNRRYFSYHVYPLIRIKDCIYEAHDMCIYDTYNEKDFAEAFQLFTECYKSSMLAKTGYSQHTLYWKDAKARIDVLLSEYTVTCDVFDVDGTNSNTVIAIPQMCDEEADMLKYQVSAFRNGLHTNIDLFKCTDMNESETI